MSQAHAFLNGEGDRWFARNKDRLDPTNDPVIACIEKLAIEPKRVVEFGCANGWRLARLQGKFNSDCVGYDPSLDAILDGLTRYEDTRIQLIHGTADCRLRYDAYDLIIFGFCLYLCDRDTLFQIAANADRALKEGGHIIIHDFICESPHSVVYHHEPSLRSYKMDYSRMFRWNPCYEPVAITLLDDEVAVTALKKSTESAWPLKMLP